MPEENNQPEKMGYRSAAVEQRAEGGPVSPRLHPQTMTRSSCRGNRGAHGSLYPERMGVVREVLSQWRASKCRKLDRFPCWTVIAGKHLIIIGVFSAGLKPRATNSLGGCTFARPATRRRGRGSKSKMKGHIYRLLDWIPGD